MDHQGDEVSVELVAEVGSNWNGNQDTAEDIFEAAASCGADTVKFQHYPDTRFGPHPMSADDLDLFNDFARQFEVGFLCSVFDENTLREYIETCSPTRVKIASPELTHHDLLRFCATAGLDIILSTGMSTEQQVSEAVAVIERANAKVTLLHCVSSYPAPPEEMNLRAMRRLSRYGPVGLSDHTEDPLPAPVAATCLGATMIEKHFTLDKDQPGPDHWYALSPDGFRVMVNAVRIAETMLGDGRKQVMPSEDPFDRRTPEWR